MTKLQSIYAAQTKLAQAYTILVEMNDPTVSMIVLALNGKIHDLSKLAEALEESMSELVE